MVLVPARSFDAAVRAITKSSNVKCVHVAETEMETANEFLDVRFHAAKKVQHRAWCREATPIVVAKAYDTQRQRVPKLVFISNSSE